MEYGGWGDLEKFISSQDYKCGPPLPDNKMMSILIQLLLGMAALHNAKMLHRDIKATNAIFESKTQNILKICYFSFFIFHFF